MIFEHFEKQKLTAEHDGHARAGRNSWTSAHYSISYTKITIVQHTFVCVFVCSTIDAS